METNFKNFQGMLLENIYFHINNLFDKYLFFKSSYQLTFHKIIIILVVITIVWFWLLSIPFEFHYCIVVKDSHGGCAKIAKKTWRHATKFLDKQNKIYIFASALVIPRRNPINSNQLSKVIFEHCNY